VSIGIERRAHRLHSFKTQTDATALRHGDSRSRLQRKLHNSL